MKTEQPIPRTFGGYISKRTNKRIAPKKYDMWQYMYDRDVKYSFDTPYKTIKEAFVNMGGMKWWENKNKQEKTSE